MRMCMSIHMRIYLQKLSKVLVLFSFTVHVSETLCPVFMNYCIFLQDLSKFSYVHVGTYLQYVHICVCLLCVVSTGPSVTRISEPEDQLSHSFAHSTSIVLCLFHF